ncbi:MAG TPA: hypothetical protein VFR14_01215 [Candidatus Limnocylindrales bacterium]|nr:hypothetical protein [Candidatus Limnocylindrales bacterium]
MRSLIWLVSLGLVVAAGCGGAAATQEPAPGAESPGTSVAVTAPPGASPTEAGASADPGTGGGGGGGTTDPCALVAAAEYERIFGVSGVTTAVVAGPPDTCDVQADGAPLAALVIVTTGGQAIFSAWASDPEGVDIPGLGDRALYSPQALLLVVLKGDIALSMAALDESRTEAERLELMKEAMSIAVGRL